MFRLDRRKIGKHRRKRYIVRFAPRRKKASGPSKMPPATKLFWQEGLVAEADKKAFAAKLRVYVSFFGKKAYEWHIIHKMPKNPTLGERIKWHSKNVKNCGYRPIPEKPKQFMEA